MTKSIITPEMIQGATAFHGHWCPGLAIGIRAAELALQEFGRSSDEEIVAVVETDMCGVDAIQYLTGCTFGKGNLIYKDYGKNAFTFYRRSDDKALRLMTKNNIFGDTQPELGRLNRKAQEKSLTKEEEQKWLSIREALSKRIMETSIPELFDVKKPAEITPKKARMLQSIICDECKEATMESRIRRFQGLELCIPCFEKHEKRF
jgi:formylmethanofuran dehydrogenase subunit E